MLPFLCPCLASLLPEGFQVAALAHVGSVEHSACRCSGRLPLSDRWGRCLCGGRRTQACRSVACACDSCGVQRGMCPLSAWEPTAVLEFLSSLQLPRASFLLRVFASVGGKCCCCHLIRVIYLRHTQFSTHVLAGALPLLRMVCPQPSPVPFSVSRVPLRTADGVSSHTEKQNKRTMLPLTGMCLDSTVL